MTETLNGWITKANLIDGEAMGRVTVFVLSIPVRIGKGFLLGMWRELRS